MADKQRYCSGCRNDYYNHDGNGMNGGKCWSLKDAEVVTRYKIGWWTQPLNAQCFTKVKTLDCHSAPGKYGLYKELPEHCRTASSRHGAGTKRQRAVTPSASDSAMKKTLLALVLLAASQLQAQQPLTYLGSFRVPSEVVQGVDLAYGGRPLAFNPANRSLFIGSLTNLVGEISIPTPMISDTISALPEARYLQPLTDPTEGRMMEVTTSSVGLYGMMVEGDRLYLAATRYYDATNDQRVSHGVRSTNLNERSFSGWSAVWRADRSGFVGGWIAPVPAEWRERLGGPAITGQCCVPIISRSSFGPAAFAFDPSRIGQSLIPAFPLVYYPIDHPTLGNWENQSAGPPTLFNQATQAGGVVIIGDRAWFVLRNGAGPRCYGYGVTNPALHGIPAADGVMQCYDPTDANKGSHAYPYRYEVQAYDLEDFAAVKAGTREPWEIRPSEVFPLTFPTSDRGAGVGGVAYDAATRTIYVSQLDTEPHPLRKPIILAFRVSVSEDRVTLLQAEVETLKTQITALTERLDQLLNALRRVGQ